MPGPLHGNALLRRAQVAMVECTERPALEYPDVWNFVASVQGMAVSDPMIPAVFIFNPQGVPNEDQRTQ
jgi:hypothetical protein